MEKSKQAKTSEGEDGIDMISNLPDHVLLSILSCLQDTEDVIRTSILSTRWRHMWTSVPYIDIDYTRGLNPFNELDTNGFTEFVYWVLLNKPQDLDSFRLSCSHFYNMLTIRQWIHAAVMRKVKLLDLMFCPMEESEDLSVIDCRTHEYVVSSSKLKNLRIHTQQLASVDDDEDDHFDSGNCLSLEISCPKLEFLKLTGYVAIYFQFENLYSLKKAVIHVQDMFLFEAPSFDFFATISHVEYLSITINCIQMKKVEFLEFDEEEPRLVVACAFLEHANELEEMVFSWSDEAKFQQGQQRL